MQNIAKSVTFAAVLSAATVLPALAQDAVQAGVSAAVRGEVQVARADAVGRQVQGGEQIFLADAITSGAESGMQILLMDETVFTIGPESELTIDEFVYDPATGDGSLAASMTKGVMKFVTGNISDGTPENMTIKLPVGTIGIRGTIGVAAILTPEQAQQQFPNQASQLSGAGGGPGAPVIFAALVGPGPLTQTNANVGSFNFNSPDGNVDLSRPGGAVLATPGAAPIFFIAPPGTIPSVNADPVQGPAAVDGETLDEGGDDSSQSGDSTGTSEQSGGDDTAGSDDSGSAPGGDTGPSGGSSETQLSGAVGESNVGNDVSFGNVDLLNDSAGTIDRGSDTSDEVAAASESNATFSDLAGVFGSSGSASASVPLSGMASAPSATASVFVSFSSRHMSLSGSNMPGGSFSTQTGQEAALFDNSTGATFSDSQLTCTECNATVSFTSSNTLNVSVTEGGETGSGSGTLQ